MNTVSLKNYKTGENVLSQYNDMLSVNDLSKIFEVSKNTIYKEMKQGKFGTPIQIGRVYKIPKIYVVSKFFYHYK